MSSIDYSKYKIEQLLEIQQHIDKAAYPDNYQALLSELELRQGELQEFERNQAIQQQARAELRAQSRSPLRVAGLLVAGLPISLPLALSAESKELTAFEQFIAVVMLLLTALPLLHSILTGRTLSHHGVVTLKSNAFSYTLMQLFYSYILGLILLMLLLR
jgi:hypothetical protein